MLGEFVHSNHQGLARRWRVLAGSPRPGRAPGAAFGAEVEGAASDFLRGLADALRCGSPGAIRVSTPLATLAASLEMCRLAVFLGRTMREHGCAPEGVAPSFALMGTTITTMAREGNAPVSPKDGQLLNGLLDRAAASAAASSRAQAVR